MLLSLVWESGTARCGTRGCDFITSYVPLAIGFVTCLLIDVFLQSNGPFEMLNILPEFFKLSSLPPGSIKLKSYAGRSLLSGFLSAPAAKKRGNLLELLDAFPESQFVLIGDSGEQDLELYTEYVFLKFPAKHKS